MNKTNQQRAIEAKERRSYARLMPKPQDGESRMEAMYRGLLKEADEVIDVISKTPDCNSKSGFSREEIETWPYEEHGCHDDVRRLMSSLDRFVADDNEEDE